MGYVEIAEAEVTQKPYLQDVMVAYLEKWHSISTNQHRLKTCFTAIERVDAIIDDKPEKMISSQVTNSKHIADVSARLEILSPLLW